MEYSEHFSPRERTTAARAEIEESRVNLELLQHRVNWLYSDLSI